MVRESWPNDQKLPIVRTFTHEGRDMSREGIERVCELLRSAAMLNLPVSVETIREKRFAHGGNVVKADFVAYRVTIGSKAQHKDD